jgi:putative ATP-dependent endonuclease of the OLD family
MRLIRLEVPNYRSIAGAEGDKAFALGGFDCLVGRNNAGKSNTLKAIRYLLKGERMTPNLHFEGNEEREVEVRGFFKVGEADLDRLKIQEKRELLEERILEDGTLGVVRRSGGSDLEILRPMPTDPRLSQDAFKGAHERAWKEKGTKSDFSTRMSEEFPELVDHLEEGKEQNKGEWEIAYDRFVSSRPEGVEFSLQATPPPQGLPADLKNLLPRLIYVPAVKEAEETTKTTKSSELGSLLADLADVIQEELDAEIREAMAAVHRRLNVVVDQATGELLDERHEGVQAIEERVSRYLSETFDGIGVRLEFPHPSTSMIIDQAEVWVEEQGQRRFRVSEVGEGVKRILVFSMIRTLADLRQGRLKVTGDQTETQPSNRPTLILYEEAELFLHPALQSILLQALKGLGETGAQVVLTTHSAFMIDTDGMTSIHVTSKDETARTGSIEFCGHLSGWRASDQTRLLQIQHASAYLFSERVVLVEGRSDKIVLEKLAPCLNSRWNFVRTGVPILPIEGKGDLPLFRDVLTGLGIKVFVVTDIDAVEDVVDRLSSADDVRTMAQDAREILGRLTAEETGVRKKDVRRWAGQGAWTEVFDSLDTLASKLEEEGGKPSEDEIDALQRLLAKRGRSARRACLHEPPGELREVLDALAEKLLEEDVLLLRTNLEGYYPASGDNKITAALEFAPEELDTEALRARFRSRESSFSTDVEAFLERVFDGTI